MFSETRRQILSLKGEEIDIVAKHLRHDIAVHREYYRLQSETLELCKVSKFLSAGYEGELGKYQGKELK